MPKMESKSSNFFNQPEQKSLMSGENMSDCNNSFEIEGRPFLSTLKEGLIPSKRSSLVILGIGSIGALGSYILTGQTDVRFAFGLTSSISYLGWWVSRNP